MQYVMFPIEINDAVIMIMMIQTEIAGTERVNFNGQDCLELFLCALSTLMSAL